jgi:DNA-binding transcriptional LysR family regulator
MDFTWMSTFLRVAELRSFTRAAGELHLSQPAVSRQVRKLEDELRVTLIDRSFGDIELTPAGERFQEFAVRTLSDFQKVLEQIQSHDVELSGPLRIAASTIPGEFLAPELAFQFTRLHPQVEPYVSIGDSTTVIEELRSGHYDVGFVGVKLTDSHIRYWAVAKDEVILVVPTSHQFATRGEIKLSELDDQPFIEREPGSGTTISVRRALTKHGRSLPNYRTLMRLSSTEAVLSAIERGHGIGWVSSLALENRRPRRVKTVRITDVAVPRTLYLATPAQRTLSDMALAFVSWVKRSRS